MRRLPSPVSALKPTLAARDFERSKQFYLDLGFELEFETDSFADFRVGSFSFRLARPPNQPALPGTETVVNYGQVIYLEVEDSEAWWDYVCQTAFEVKYPESSPSPPFFWGKHRMMVIHDPSGISWRILKAASSSAT